MAKNIVIQENGVAKQLTADKLKTNLVGGGTCLWVPEDGTTLGVKTITQNGTYNASDDGYYGYSQVIVNGQGTATGTDGDGDEAVAHTDPITGELQTDKVPSSIEVVTPPTNPYGIYQNGQAIGTNGMVVKAYLQTGGEYGTVPNGEITLNPTTAAYDPSTDTMSGEATSGGIVVQYSGTYTSANDWLCSDFEYAANFGAATYVFSSTNSPASITYPPSSPESEPIKEYMRLTGPNTTPGGHTFYMTGSLPANPALPVGVPEGIHSPADLAAVIYDGTREQTQSGSHQEIAVSWPRPLDGKVLETTFEILVAPPNGSED